MVGRQLTREQRVFIVENYILTRSIQNVHEAFRNTFIGRYVPKKSTILNNVRKYHEHGTSSNLNQGRSGRRRTARSAENIELVRDLLENNPRVSVRRNGSNISNTSFHRIIKHDLNYYPYVLITRQELKENDFGRRETFSRWLIDRFQENDFINQIVIGDEATFQMNGSVNTHNLREYAPRGQPPPNFNYDVL